MCAYICVCVCMYACACMYVRMYTCIYVWHYLSVSPSPFIKICLPICVIVVGNEIALCMYVCMFCGATKILDLQTMTRLQNFRWERAPGLRMHLFATEVHGNCVCMYHKLLKICSLQANTPPFSREHIAIITKPSPHYVLTESIISSPWRSIGTRPSPHFSPQLRHKIWEWPGNNLTLPGQSCCWIMGKHGYQWTSKL